MDVQQLTHSVRALRLSVPLGFESQPGQYVNLLVPVNGTIQRRSYSIAIQGDDFIEIALNKVENGIVSPLIYELKKENTITIQGPLGVFLLKDHSPYRESVFIATGTGIVPFLNMITNLLSKTKKKVMLLAGFKNEKELIYNKEFKNLENMHPNFEYHTIVSNPEHKNTEKGRVQILLKKHVLPDFTGDFYLCGLSEMVKDIGIILARERNVNSERIIFERYN